MKEKIRVIKMEKAESKGVKAVSFLKNSVKQILTKKQEKRYEIVLGEKKMSYDVWIRRQEEKIQVADIIVLESTKCLTNDISDHLPEGNVIQNEGFHSENALTCRFFEVFDKKQNKEDGLSFLLLPGVISNGTDGWALLEIIKKSDADVILFQNVEGELASVSLPLFYKKFVEDKNIILIYGDEDVEGGGIRCNPWFKPDWSPDTFLSAYYFGSLTAVRREQLIEALKEYLDENLMTEGVAGKDGLCPVVYSLYEKMLRANQAFAVRTDGEPVPVIHIPEIVFHAKEEAYYAVKDWKLSKSFPVKETPMVSIIIPSKDNPAVLFTCIHSLIQKTDMEYSCEILIIDNGSNEENKREIETEIQKLNQNADGGKEGIALAYHYHPMAFNFSRMCNMGAELAKGNLLLFLNDDMEIIQNDWLSSMIQKAVLPYAGAVGAKLLYPDSDIIQHAGITNLRVGPAHKLQFLSDEENHYYGKNRGVHNMLAVTGACLLVRRSVFEKVGGFEEKLAVAFNDVDLCYKIHEAGYYNIVRNDVVLYHHESLSRGKDGESEEKQLRLLREKDVLYEMHQEVYGKDPFYHKYLTADMLESEYSPAYHYQVDLSMPWAKVDKKDSLPENIKEDGCVVIGMEGAMDIYKWKYGVKPELGKVEPVAEDMGYYFQGYTFVIGANNACYKKTLLLENKENKQVFYVQTEDKYRPDIRKNLKDQLNVDLTGFAGKVRLEDVPEGVYRFGMLAEDRCSRQKLVNWSSWVLRVDGTNKSVTDTLQNTRVNGI